MTDCSNFSTNVLIRMLSNSCVYYLVGMDSPIVLNFVTLCSGSTFSILGKISLHSFVTFCLPEQKSCEFVPLVCCVLGVLMVRSPAMLDVSHM